MNLKKIESTAHYIAMCVFVLGIILRMLKVNDINPNYLLGSAIIVPVLFSFNTILKEGKFIIILKTLIVTSGVLVLINLDEALFVFIILETVLLVKQSGLLMRGGAKEV